MQPSSTEKPAVKALAARGLPIVVGDLAGDVDELAKVLKGFDTLISAIHAHHILAQVKLVDAAKKAGVKRFVPCDFAVVIPPGGLMKLRDEKEVVHQRVCELPLLLLSNVRAWLLESPNLQDILYFTHSLHLVLSQEGIHDLTVTRARAPPIHLYRDRLLAPNLLLPRPIRPP